MERDGAAAAGFAALKEEGEHAAQNIFRLFIPPVFFGHLERFGIVVYLLYLWAEGGEGVEPR